MLINAQNLDALMTSFKTIFNQGFEQTESYVDKLAMMLPSSGREEDYVWIGQVPAMREWVGDRVINNPEAFSYVIKNRTFESTVMIGREDIEDDKIGVFSPMIQQLGALSKIHPDDLIFGLLKNGFTGRCYDGQNFFDADHPVAGESVSNVDTGTSPAWYLFDTSKAIKPFIFQTRRNYALSMMDKPNDANVFMRAEYIYGVDARVNAGYGLWQFAYASTKPLTAENYAAARAAMRSFKADNGKPLHVTPNVLVVPPQLEDSARKLLIATQNSAGASNVNAGTSDLLVSAWLD